MNHDRTERNEKEGETEETRKQKREREREADRQVTFGHLQNLLTPLARQEQFIFRTIYSVPRG